MVEVDAASAYGVERVVGDATLQHLVVEVVIAHVACSTVAVGHNHHLVDPKLKDGDDEAAHGRVEGRDYQSTCVLDDLGIAVFQSQCSGQ